MKGKEEHIERLLAELGLSPEGARVYVSLLRGGAGTLTDIARRTGIKRTTLYQHVDTLLSGELAAKAVRKKRLYYRAEDPRRILAALERRRKRFEGLLPELSALFVRSPEWPGVRFFEGKQGLRTLYREMTRTTQVVYSVFAADRYWSVFDEKDGKEFLENIYQGGGNLRDLVENTKSGRLYVELARAQKAGKSKLLPEGFSVASDMVVSGKKVAFISFRHLVGVLVENEDIAGLQRNIVQWMWKNSGKE